MATQTGTPRSPSQINPQRDESRDSNPSRDPSTDRQQEQSGRTPQQDKPMPNPQTGDERDDPQR